MLHTNISSFFLGSMNHVQAEAKTDPFGCCYVKHLRLNGVNGISNTRDSITHCAELSQYFEWKSRLTMSIATSKARNSTLLSGVQDPTPS